MRKLFIILLLIFIVKLPAFSGIVQGGVEKERILGSNKVVDYETNSPVSGAKISIPQGNYSTYTDENGQFNLGADINKPTVISVEKAGYKPYSMTVNKISRSKPIVMSIEKTTPKDITIDTNMFHLGDNSYSELSANAGEFQVQSVGPFYSKKVKIPTITPGTKVNLIIGSIIGVDTLLAKSMGQNKVVNAYASPTEVYFNGNKIADIQVNGDGQRIRVPYNLIKQNQLNEITIKTGRNLSQTAYVDYDDIEFMNLSVETN
ncbi:MAG: carboxypeptidase-like regulatory domain-containing protein [Candidatus Gastranaerophilales bacterium]|nr:carboxypeptidase-like regulatory domain-containing protein [Candidatus Gastranaerophilales bacterium]